MIILISTIIFYVLLSKEDNNEDDSFLKTTFRHSGLKNNMTFIVHGKLSKIYFGVVVVLRPTVGFKRDNPWVDINDSQFAVLDTDQKTSFLF